MIQIKERSKTFAQRPIVLWLPSIAFTFFVLAITKPAWFDGNLFAFRDTLHFYFPLWYHIDQMELADRILPFWNSLDGFGASIIGEPTSMIFYPLRCILLLPVGNLQQRIGFFIAIHIVIAYAATTCSLYRSRLISHSHYSVWVIQTCSWCYALSGPIFFQVYNPPFLVGAAWLPIVMAGTLELLNFKAVYGYKRQFNNVVLIGFFSSLMILGGDAQSVYHVVLLTCLLLVINIIYCSLLNHASLFRSITNIPLIAFAFALAASLAAVQILPTMCWISISERLGYANEARYQFQSSPFDLITLLAPRLFGSHVPDNTRWSQLLVPDARIWISSVHIGSLLVAASIIGWCTNRNWISLLTFTIAILSLLSSIGNHLPFGGIYGLWADWLPLYGSFRYPSKWLTISTWTFTFMACLTICQSIESRWFLRSIAYFFGMALLISSTVLATHLFIVGIESSQNWVMRLLQEIPADEWCGAIKPELVIRDLGRTGAIGIFAAAVPLFVLLRHLKSNRDVPSRFTFVFLLLPVVLEVSLFAVQEIVFVNPNPIMAAIQTNASQDTATYSDSQQKVLKQMRYRLGKLHLLFHERSFQAQFSIEPRIMHHISENQFAANKRYRVKGDAKIESFIEQANKIEFQSNTIVPTSIQFAVLDDGGWRIMATTSKNAHRTSALTSANSKSHNDEKSTMAKKTNNPGDLLTILLPPGQSGVSIVYRTPNLLLGMVISTVSAFILMSVVYCNNRYMANDSATSL